ncbi:TetR/AcrR family transcriptional regulator [Streptomyces chumphonensis]|uniref:TetR/AcrR family transcriptional regulator n=1 Tax=Streptomyces chumphonensis TaxID=1214925 RepID=UPI003D7514D1
MTEGLRERKKRQTRQCIADAAAALFAARGFDAVTVAEIAEAAEVSVNTVYNHFAAKEDLVLPPEETTAQHLADVVRRRGPGESAAHAVLAHLRAELGDPDRRRALTDGFGRTYRTMRSTPALTARLERLRRRMTDVLAAELRTGTGAAPDDPMPRLVATQIAAFHSLVHTEIGERVAAGQGAGEITAAVRALLDAVEELGGERFLGYAARPR